MEILHRTQEFYLFNQDVNASRMIFLSGPRQVGKTTFIKNRLKRLGLDELYFNWDDPYVFQEYHKNPHFLKGRLARSGKTRPLVAFDEIHKHKKWKNILKGLYDIHRDEAQFVITGSARLDYFRQSGDSLVGRYFSYAMLPVGLVELSNTFEYVQNSDNLFRTPNNNGLLPLLASLPVSPFKSGFDRLLTFGGFPEPLAKASTGFSTKWRKNYLSLLIGEDVRDLTRIMDIKGLEQLVLLLPERVGSPLSINSIARDLHLHFSTVSAWLEALKKIYLVFTLPPWTGGISKAIKKENKLYFFDWTLTTSKGAQFENMLSVALLRYCHRLNEYGMGDYELRFIRNVQKKEVDFVLINGERPVALFEAKVSSTNIDKSGYYFAQALGVPYYQIVADTDIVEAYPDDCFILSAWRVFALLG